MWLWFTCHRGDGSSNGDSSRMVLRGQSELDFMGIQYSCACYLHVAPAPLQSPDYSMAAVIASHPLPHVHFTVLIYSVEEAKAGVTRSLGTDMTALDKVHIVFPGPASPIGPSWPLQGLGIFKRRQMRSVPGTQSLWLPPRASVAATFLSRTTALRSQHDV